MYNKTRLHSQRTTNKGMHNVPCSTVTAASIPTSNSTTSESVNTNSSTKVILTQNKCDTIGNSAHNYGTDQLGTAKNVVMSNDIMDTKLKNEKKISLCSYTLSKDNMANNSVPGKFTENTFTTPTATDDKPDIRPKEQSSIYGMEHVEFLDEISIDDDDIDDSDIESILS